MSSADAPLRRCQSVGGGNQHIGALRCGLEEGHQGSHNALIPTGAAYVSNEETIKPMTHEQHVESLARELHEAGRAAVEAGLVINKVPGQPFFTWDEITEGAKEGRRVQARFLIARGYIDVQALPPV